MREREPVYPPEFDYEPAYPTYLALVSRADGTQGVVLDTYTPDSESEPDWYDEDDEERDVLVAFEDQQAPMKLSEIEPVENEGEGPAPIVRFNVDEAHYIGDEDDGCYFQVRGFAGVWFVTVVVDCDTGSFCENLTTDGGPYYSEDAAALAGQRAATDWCMENNVGFETDVEPEPEPEPMEIKPHILARIQAALDEAHDLLMDATHGDPDNAASALVQVCAAQRDLEAVKQAGAEPKPEPEVVYMCVADRFDRMGEVYDSVEQFKEMCCAAFGEVPELREMNGDYQDMEGNVVLIAGERGKVNPGD